MRIEFITEFHVMWFLQFNGCKMMESAAYAAIHTISHSRDHMKLAEDMLKELYRNFIQPVRYTQFALLVVKT